MSDYRERGLPKLEQGGKGRIPRVAIASSVLLYREGLAASLAKDGRVDVVAVTDPFSALAAVMNERPDVVLIDASSKDGLGLARRLKNAAADVLIVGFGISECAGDVIASAEAGLVGFIDHNGSIDALVKVVTDAMRGEFTCSPRVATMLCDRLARLAKRDEESSASLTPREREIAGLISEGLSNKEIALGLHIGPATVKNHVHNILDKLKVRRRSAVPGRIGNPGSFMLRARPSNAA